LPHSQDFGSKVKVKAEEPQKILLTVWNENSNWLNNPFKKLQELHQKSIFQEMNRKI
jgi:hypothetical protein